VTPVIPGRAEGANPESRAKRTAVRLHPPPWRAGWGQRFAIEIAHGMRFNLCYHAPEYGGDI
jgi:hypothetical protein